MKPCHRCEIVRENAWDGYPAEYLVVRVKGRQATLITDWPSLIERRGTSGLSDDQVWGAFLHELSWLHRQMNKATLRATAPLFALFEIKTLVLALRNVAIHRSAGVRALLERSLLDRRIEKVLLAAEEVRAALNALAQLTIPAAHLFAELPELYDTGKLRAVEDGLMKGYLETATVARLHPVLCEFFVQFIDLRNVMLVYKHLRWDTSEAPRLIRGGNIPLARLRRICTHRDSAALNTLVQRAVQRPHPSVSTDAALETLLLQSITRKLARRRRDEHALTVVVSYMWRLYIQARNLATVVQSTGVERHVLERELIA